jgi:outer membrane protein OmpA-like peptidoglycan-associated protein
MKNFSVVYRPANAGWFLLLLSFLYLGSAALYGEDFAFSYREGDQYRILSEIQQNVYLNEVFQYSAELLNRIQVEVVETEGSRGFERVFYQHSVEARSGFADAYQLDKEYSAEFWRDELGRYEIADGYFVPTVRDVPVFPGGDVRVGDTWSAPGYEVHDFREGFGISEAFRFSMPVSYRYAGTVEIDGVQLEHIEIEYNIYYRKDVPRGYTLYPYLITGRSEQNLYFDALLGRPHSYNEVYDIMLHLNDGSTVRYEGSASAYVIESEDLDRNALRQELEDALEDLGVEDSEVIEDERGVTISLENIRFQADSARLLPSETEKLDKIAQILSRYPQRDILVSGHTALAGTAAGRLRLSEERARAVVEYLLELGVRDRANIMFQGFGAERPVASNDTPEGMSRNRRVEITILEN